MIKAFIIIPAKADSKRLIGKNKRVIAGKTLVEHSIEYAKNSKLAGKVLLSTEDEETRNIAESYGVEVVGRTTDYMGEREVADVYVKIFKEYGDDTFTHVVGVQPDHPDRTIPLDEMLEYTVENKYDDLVTVDSSGTRNGSIRITKAQYVKDGTMSRRVGSMLDDCTNIHSEEDLRQAEKNIQNDHKKWYHLSELQKHHINHCAQSGEDGLLEYIFENIEPKSKCGVEFGAGKMGSDGTPNLKYSVDEHGWKTVMWEWKQHKNTQDFKRKYGIFQEVVTSENVNDLFGKYNVPKNVDVVVIDVDGQDYWIWEALKWKPQVVEIEFNTQLDFNDAIVMEKDSRHHKTRDTKSGHYGASVAALKKLGEKKGYTLIDRCGRNLFFILNELIDDDYEVSIKDLEKITPDPGLNADSGRKLTGDEKWVNV